MTPGMRKLTQEESDKVFAKLDQFVGDRKEELLKNHNIYLHNKNVFYVSNLLYKKVSNIPKKSIAMVGTHIGRFTRSDRFFLKVGALNVLSAYVTKKVWIKWSAEMNFLYGNNVLKSHVLKTTEDLKDRDIVFLYNPRDVLLGFGITARNMDSFNKADHNSLFVIKQCDKGEYIRNEAEIL